MSWAAQDEWAGRNGLRKSRADHCPRVVAGKRCLIYYGNPATVCDCQQPAARPLLDHVRVWVDAHGDRVLTTEPYGCKPEQVDRLRNLVAPLGLRIDVGDESPWNPGSTTLLRISRATPSVKSGTTPAVTWTAVEKTLKRLGAHRSDGTDRDRGYTIWIPGTGAGPQRERLLVRVRLNRRWSTVAVDRIFTCGSPVDEAESWYRGHLDPFVHAARQAMTPAVRHTHLGQIPHGGDTYVRVDPVARDDVPALLEAWIPQEVAWCGA